MGKEEQVGSAFVSPKFSVMKKLLSLFLASLLLASCSKHLIINFSDSASNTGSLTIQPSRPISRTYLTVDDKLLVERKYVKKITVNQIPAGEHEFHLVCSNYAYKEKVDEKRVFQVEANAENTQLFETPPISTGYWIFSSLTVGGYFALITIGSLTGDEDE